MEEEDEERLNEEEQSKEEEVDNRMERVATLWHSGKD
jgi:hypothetical protein